uniref:Uncharacterized protein n=1 Tax=Anguilla anguilla TaxID=7936 RepID=A0A0E9SC49_ANGAN
MNLLMTCVFAGCSWEHSTLIPEITTD